MIFNRYNVKLQKPEQNFGESLADSTGYISPKNQIESMLLAGKRLQMARDEMYDFPDGVIDENVTLPPTRRKSFDMAEASMMLNDTKDRIKASQNARKASESVKKGVIDDKQTKTAGEPVEPLV